MHVTAIIAAGGRGARFGGSVPKQLIELGGRTILQRTVDAFDLHPRVDRIIVALPTEWVGEKGRYVRGGLKPLQVVSGGVDRQASVASAFENIAALGLRDVFELHPSPGDVILVHDGARPLVSAALIDRMIDAAAAGGAAIPALPASDTVKSGRTEGTTTVVDRTLPRHAIYLAQTPQAFRYEVLSAAVAFGRAGHQGTDEAALAESAGYAVHLVDGESRNIKITTPEDLELARGWLAADEQLRSRMIRIGTGYDLHTLVENRPLVLGGVTIPFALGLAGHSDADAVCHAIADAVLGAAAVGDIGQHFPDTDAMWRNADGMTFVAAAREIVRRAGFEVYNVDAVVIAEAPKLAPYVDEVRTNLAAWLGVDRSRVSVKAKTNEGVDATGEGRAIAVHAIAMLREIR